MLRTSSITGFVIEERAPDFAPLESVVGAGLAIWFMWMFEVELDDGRHLHVYKHLVTRRYLHLSRAGEAFEFRNLNNGTYCQIALATAIVRAFWGWEQHAPSNAEVESLVRAVRSARQLAA